MSIITIATSKGGAGKTTLAQLLSGTIAKRGHRVRAADLEEARAVLVPVGHADRSEQPGEERVGAAAHPAHRDPLALRAPVGLRVEPLLPEGAIDGSQ